MEIQLDKWTLSHILYFLWVWPGCYVMSLVIISGRRFMQSIFVNYQRGARSWHTMAFGEEKIMVKEAGLWLGFVLGIVTNFWTEATQGIAPGEQNFFDPIDVLVGWIPTVLVFMLVYKLRKFFE